jgi:glycogen phosphorylase
LIFLAPSLIKKYLGKYIAEELKISMHDFLALGRKNPANESELFNTSYLAIRGSGKINGVSKLHGKISRQFLQSFLKDGQSLKCQSTM